MRGVDFDVRFILINKDVAHDIDVQIALVVEMHIGWTRFRSMRGGAVRVGTVLIEESSVHGVEG
jgi:hypothetical protein